MAKSQKQQKKKSRKFGRNAVKCQRYRVRHGGPADKSPQFQHRHGSRHRDAPMVVTGITHGLMLPGEEAMTRAMITLAREHMRRRS